MRLCIVGFLLAVCLSLTLKADTLKGKVVRVADGDTLTVLDETKTQHKVRLNKIDAPEKGQAFGTVSKKHLSEYVFGKNVKVELKTRLKNMGRDMLLVSRKRTPTSRVSFTVQPDL